MKLISSMYPMRQTIRESDDVWCGYGSTKIYRVIRGNLEYIYGFIRTDCKDSGYYKLLQVRKFKIVRFNNNEAIRVTAPLYSDKWTIYHPYVNVAFIHKGVELVEP